MTSYKITATATDHNGQRVDANSAEVLGDAYEVEYSDKAEAEAKAEELSADADEFFAGQAVTYTVEQA